MRHGVCQANQILAGMHGNPVTKTRASNRSRCGWERRAGLLPGRGRGVTAGRQLGGRHTRLGPAPRRPCSPSQNDSHGNGVRACLAPSGSCPHRIGSRGGPSLCSFQRARVSDSFLPGPAPVFPLPFSQEDSPSVRGLQAVSGMLGPGWSWPPSRRHADFPGCHGEERQAGRQRPGCGEGTWRRGPGASFGLFSGQPQSCLCSESPGVTPPPQPPHPSALSPACHPTLRNTEFCPSPWCREGGGRQSWSEVLTGSHLLSQTRKQGFYMEWHLVPHTG